MLCNIRKKKVAVLLMGPNEWLLYWFLFEGLILNDFLISPGLPPLPWFGVRSPCSYSKVFAYAALPPPLVKAGGITDDWKVNGRMKWGGLRVCLTGNWVLGGNERLLLRPPSEWRREIVWSRFDWRERRRRYYRTMVVGCTRAFLNDKGNLYQLREMKSERWLWLAIALWALSRPVRD